MSKNKTTWFTRRTHLVSIRNNWTMPVKQILHAGDVQWKTCSWLTSYWFCKFTCVWYKDKARHHRRYDDASAENGLNQEQHVGSRFGSIVMRVMGMPPRSLTCHCPMSQADDCCFTCAQFNTKSFSLMCVYRSHVIILNFCTHFKSGLQSKAPQRQLGRVTCRVASHFLGHKCNCKRNLAANAL